MRRIRIAGLCLVAALVASIAMTATASATAPELGRCVKNVPVEKKYSGGYSDSKCTKAVSPAEQEKKGKYDWLPGPGAKNGFTSSGGAATLATKGGKTVTCTSEKSSGEFIVGTDNKHEKTTVEFAGVNRAASPAPPRARRRANSSRTNCSAKSALKMLRKKRRP